jgi:predicted O-methyltransferase YrrM
MEELEGLKFWYDQRAKAFVGGGFVEMAMSLPGAAFVLETLAAIDSQVRIADLGAGFSTVFLGTWLCNWSEYGGELWTMDHNPQWLAFMRVIAVDLGLPLERVLEREKFLALAPREAFDVIVVDQGPELQTRADDLPWTVTLLAPGGVLLFDDWRPKHEGRVRRALAGLGDWEISSAEHTRRSPRDKAIGVARRKR